MIFIHPDSHKEASFWAADLARQPLHYDDNGVTGSD